MNNLAIRVGKKMNTNNTMVSTKMKISNEDLLKKTNLHKRLISFKCQETNRHCYYVEMLIDNL